MGKVMPFLFALPLLAQLPAFEAATIKPTAPGTRGDAVVPRNGALHTVNTTLKTLVETAYRVQPPQVAGGPSWAGAAHFDIDAKGAPGTTGPQLRLMLRALLQERFALQVHNESRVLPAYRLVVEKGGPKFPESGAGECPAVPGREHPCGGFRLSNRSHLYGERVGMIDLAEMLEAALGRAVIDQTSLGGEYTVKLDWTPDETLFPGLGAERPDAPSGELDGSSLFTALREQLGLRLESFRGPVPVIVIDAASRPGAN